MNVFNRVTIKSLKRNRTRTVVTIIGIMLSAAMICAVTTFVSSVQNFALNQMIYSTGDWHGTAKATEWSTYEKIAGSNEVEAASYNQILGYAKIDSKNEYKPYMYVIGGEKYDFFKMLPVHLISGNYPQNENEIIIPEHLLSNGGVNYKEGDVITLDIGERLMDGYSMGQNNPCYSSDSETGEDVLNDEVIEVKASRAYEVVGIYQRPEFENYTAPGYTAITISDKETYESSMFDVYFRMNKPSEVYDFVSKMNIEGDYNSDVLMMSGVFAYNSFTSVLVSLGSIVIGLIMFGSIALIYNAFAISVSERTKQFGLLSSIGATRKQLKKMVLFEALSVSAVGIPLGIIVGISGIGITLLLIGGKFTSIVGGGYDEPMRVCVSWLSIVIAVIVALVTVLISAWIPSKRATRVSAVAAIRQNIDIKTRNKKVRTSKITYMLFGLPGVIASKHYKRNKKKYRTTVVSLFMSIVLFVSAASFTDYLMESAVDGLAKSDFELTYTISNEDLNGKTPDDVLKLLKEDEYVTNAAYVYMRTVSGMVAEEYVTDEYSSSLASLKDGYYPILARTLFVNDSEFDKLVKENGLKKEDFYNRDDPVSIAVDENVLFDGANGKYVLKDVLRDNQSKIVYEVQENWDDYDGESASYTLKTKKAIVDCPFYVDRGNDTDVYLIYPVSMMEHVLPDAVQGNHIYSYIQSKDHTESYANLKKVMLENNLASTNFYDIAENEEENRNLITIIRVFAYGFIVLISLIAAANVFNTISTNISLRRREFAMLKSVGMTEKGFNKMMNYECLLYGSKALLLGLPAAAGVTYMIYRSVSGGFETSYKLPWGAIGISVLSVFLVVFITMVYSMSKIKKDNPIDALKNENL